MSLPFEDNNYEMVLVLPPLLESNTNLFIKDGKLKSLLPYIMQPGTLPLTEGIISLPRFEVKQKFDLKETLLQVILVGTIKEFQSLKQHWFWKWR